MAVVPLDSQISPAVRTRSVLAVSTDLRVGVLQDVEPVTRHVVEEDGSVVFQPSPVGRLSGLVGRLPESPLLTLTAYDVATVPLADRIRGQVTLYGVLVPAGQALRLRPTQVVVRWRCEPGEAEDVRHLVPLSAYAAARPEPVAEAEPAWLAHLHAAHRDDLALLAAHVRSTDAARVLPVALDRRGLVLRIQRADGHEDVRLAFPRPARCACETTEAFAALLAEHGLGEQSC